MGIRFVFLMSLVLITLLSSCDSIKAWYAREFRQAEVADGIARLSTQSLSMIVNELTKNKQFGFDGPQAKVSIVRSGEEETWGKGTVTVTVSDQEISYPERKTVYVNCLGDEASIRGRVRIKKATREITGLLTNNQENPVIPDPDSTVIRVELEFDNLKVKFSSVDEHLKFKSGIVSFVFHPLLAQSQSGLYKGLKVVGTPNATFEEVRLENAVVVLHSPEVKMEVPIDRSNLSIHVGKGISGKENYIAGEIRIFDTKHDVPHDRQGLDPKYNALEFNKGYECHAEIMGNVSFDHKTAEEILGPAAAGLNALVVGALAETIEKDQRCGFSAYQTMKQAEVRGAEAEVGEAIFHLPKACDLHFNNFTTEPDVFGNAILINGTAIIEKGRKKLEGLIATTSDGLLSDVEAYQEQLLSAKDPLSVLSDKPQPILPVKRQMATVSFDGQFQEFMVKPICLDKGLITHKDHCKNDKDQDRKGIIIHSGKIASVLEPLMAKDLGDGFAAGFCGAPTKNAHGNIELKKVKMSIANTKMSMGLFADGRFDFYSGHYLEHENKLMGSLSINDGHVPFIDGAQSWVPLDPFYEREKFKNSYLLGQKIEDVADDKDCGAEEPLAPNIARLVVANAAHFLRISTDPRIEGNFVDKKTVRNRELSNNESRLRLFGSSKNVANFSVVPSKDFWHDPDGCSYEVKGSIASITGTLETNGERLHAPRSLAGLNMNFLGNRFLEMAEAWYYDQDYIFVRPTKPDSTNIALKAKPRQFRVVQKYAEPQRSTPYLEIENGLYLVDANPIRGRDQREKKRKTYSIATPIVRFNEIGVKNSYLKLKSRGLSIPVFIKSARISAQNGFFKGQGNYIEGEIDMIIGNHHRILNDQLRPIKKIRIKRQPLLKGYKQEVFDHAYRETPNLLQTISPY